MRPAWGERGAEQTASRVPREASGPWDPLLPRSQPPRAPFPWKHSGETPLWREATRTSVTCRNWPARWGGRDAPRGSHGPGPGLGAHSPPYLPPLRAAVVQCRCLRFALWKPQHPPGRGPRGRERPDPNVANGLGTQQLVLWAGTMGQLQASRAPPPAPPSWLNPDREPPQHNKDLAGKAGLRSPLRRSRSDRRRASRVHGAPPAPPARRAPGTPLAGPSPLPPAAHPPARWARGWPGGAGHLRFAKGRRWRSPPSRWRRR